MNLELFREIKSMGKAEYLIEDLITHELLHDLSKHNDFFDSIHEEESEKLELIRLQLAYIKDKLDEILACFIEE